MAALSLTVPSRVGTLSPPAAVAASDTISSTVLGAYGVYLDIINGNASPDSVTISDAGSTPGGTPVLAGSYAATVTNATAKSFFISPRQADPATGLVTITHSVTATVTYKMFPASS